MPELIHYVKFHRGTISAYESLKAAHQISDDTLYFVYSSKSAEKGLLYLGEKLISGTSESGVPSEISLEDLENVSINNRTLANQQILVYKNGEWVNSSLSEIISTAVSVMEGATELADGKAGLVPQPLQTDRNKFLKGDGTWSSINIPSFSSKQFEEDSSTGKIILKGSSELTENQVPMSDGAGGIKWAPIAIGTLSREVVNSVNDIDLNDSNTIYFVRKSGETPSDDSYEEYLVINGSAERLGGSNVNLEGYATTNFVRQEIKTLADILNDTTTTDPNTGDPIITPGLVSKVDSLMFTQTAIGDLSIYTNKNTTLVERVEEINERLIWNELEEE